MDSFFRDVEFESTVPNVALEASGWSAKVPNASVKSAAASIRPAANPMLPPLKPEPVRHDKVLNPRTGRMVMVAGDVFRKELLGVYYDADGNKLPSYDAQLAAAGSHSAPSDSVGNYIPIPQSEIDAIIKAGPGSAYTKISSDDWKKVYSDRVKRDMDATCGAKCHLATKPDGKTVYHICNPVTYMTDGCRADCGVLKDTIKHAQFQGKRGGLVVRDIATNMYARMHCDDRRPV